MTEINVNEITKENDDNIIDQLQYTNYRWNRIQFPSHKPVEYACVYKDWEIMERRFQSEAKHNDES